jgi:hypothetical protein
MLCIESANGEMVVCCKWLIWSPGALFLALGYWSIALRNSVYSDETLIMSSKKIVLEMELSLASSNLNVQGYEQSCFCVEPLHLRLDIQMCVIDYIYDKAAQVCNREFLHSRC